MKWIRSEIGPRTIGYSIWDRSIPAALIREMRSNPGVTFQLTDDEGTPIAWPAVDVQALTRACIQPFRVQSRAISREQKGGPRHVWVSMDPGHWERVAKVRKAKK